MVFYLLAFLPILVGGVLWFFNRDRLLVPWIISAAVAFAMAGGFYALAIHGMTADIETWSGDTVRIAHCPAWTEQWEEMHTRTVGSGKNEHTEIYYTTEYDHHSEHWVADFNFGTADGSEDISEPFYEQIKQTWGGETREDGTQCYDHGGTCVSGDNKEYATWNATGYQWPVTTTKHFKNKIKAAPTVFSFTGVPTNVPVYEWPENPDTFASQRVLGTAVRAVNLRQWDLMNSRLGPSKKVNAIIVGFSSADENLGHYQQAKWIGGKKNDLVITFGGDPAKPSWCFVFGWTEHELCKRNLESYVMAHGVAGKDFVQAVETEIRKNYELKDWKKFDYISVTPKPCYYYWYFGAMLLVQTGLWIFFEKEA